jgi:hypothetical protein
MENKMRIASALCILVLCGTSVVAQESKPAEAKPPTNEEKIAVLEKKAAFLEAALARALAQRNEVTQKYLDMQVQADGDIAVSKLAK